MAKRIFKWFGITVLVLIVGLFIFIQFFLKDFLVNKLSEKLGDTFQDYYAVSFTEIRPTIGWDGLGIEIVNPSFVSDTSNHELNKRYPSVFFKARQLNLSHIGIRKLLYDNELVFDDLELTDPQLSLIVKPDVDSMKVRKLPKKHKGKETIIQKIKLKNLHITGGNVSACYNGPRCDTMFLGQQIDVALRDIDLMPSRLNAFLENDKNFRDFAFAMDHAFFKPSKSDYFFSMDSLRVNHSKRSIITKNIMVLTKIPTRQLSEKLAYRKELPETYIKGISLQGYDVQKFIGENKLCVRNITIDNPDLEVINNMRLEKNKNKEKLLWQDALMMLPYPPEIDTLRMVNVDLRFEITHKITGLPVNFFLNKMNVLFTNVKTTGTEKDTMHMTIKALMMKEAPLTLIAHFPLAETYKNTYEGSVGSISLAKFDQILSAHTGIHLQDGGRIHAINFSGHCNNTENIGRLTFLYNNFNVDIRKKDDKRKQAKVLTRLGNLIIRNNNPGKEGDEPLSVNFYFKRQLFQGQVMIWLGGILEGLKNTLLDKETVAKIVKIQKTKDKLFKKKK